MGTSERERVQSIGTSEKPIGLDPKVHMTQCLWTLRFHDVGRLIYVNGRPPQFMAEFAQSQPVWILCLVTRQSDTKTELSTCLFIQFCYPPLDENSSATTYWVFFIYFLPFPSGFTYTEILSPGNTWQREIVHLVQLQQEEEGGGEKLFKSYLLIFPDSYSEFLSTLQLLDLLFQLWESYCLCLNCIFLCNIPLTNHQNEMLSLGMVFQTAVGSLKPQST